MDPKTIVVVGGFVKGVQEHQRGAVKGSHFVSHQKSSSYKTRKKRAYAAECVLCH
jgi:hypothetical protein